MQEVKISLQIGEITHEIGEKKNTDRNITSLFFLAKKKQNKKSIQSLSF